MSKHEKKKGKDKSDKPAKAAKVEIAPPPVEPVKAPKAEKAKAKKPAGKARSKAPIGFSTDDIALRAYFIAEKRQSLGHPGDEMGDWVEAERQLRAESADKA